MSKFGNRILNEDEGDLPAEMVLLSYHSWVVRNLSPTTALAVYITLWLKICIVPSLPCECIPVRVLYPTMQLVYGRPLGLLLAIVCHLQHGLRLLSNAFINNPNPHIDFSHI